MKSQEYAGFGLYGEPDVSLDVGYFFWLAHNTNRTVLIDCGYNTRRAEIAGRFHSNTLHVSPLEALRRIGIQPGDVDQLILSHLHLDHAGNVDLFPNATISLTRAEFDWWAGPYGTRELVSHLIEPETLAYLRAAEGAGRLHLIDDATFVAPGIRMLPVGGHTPGQAVTEVQAHDVKVVLAADSAHFYEEYLGDRPFWLYSDLEDAYRVYDMLRTLDATDGVVVVPGHDPLVMDRFERLDDRIANLGVPQPGG